jgi:phosphoribosylanthranilate isomerase
VDRKEGTTVFVKVCGITRVEDAVTAIDLGASALGFVFWPDSPRFVDPFRARAIVAALPPFVSIVGVFVNQPAEYVNGVATLARLTAVQLHGDEDPAFAAGLTRPVIKAVAGPAADSNGDWPRRVTLLVDAHDPARRGGTGTPADWAAAAAIARSRRVLLAGGLTPENVSNAVARVRPFGVDVSSGVESSPGIKDRGRMTAFFEALGS